MDLNANPVQERTSKIALVTLAVVLFLSALILAGVKTLGFDISLRLIGAFLLVAIVLNTSEIIGKRFTGISPELKSYTTQQKAVLIINALALIVALLLLFEVKLNLLAGFGIGVLFLESFTIFLEAFR